MTGSAGEPNTTTLTDNRSLDLSPAYEEAKTSQDKATEASNATYAKKRGMLTEVKHFKEQRDEIRQWERLRDAKVSASSLLQC